MKLSQILLLSASLLSFQAHAMDPYEVVEHVYPRKVNDPNITYSPDTFIHDPDGSTYSAPSQRPQKPRPQNSLNYTKNSHKFIQEALLKKVQLGVDGRTRIRNTTDWPNSIHAHINIILDGAEYGGSGVMVGPHHLLTCGHCVYNFSKRKFYDEIEVYPALNGNLGPFDKVKVTKSYIFRSWIDGEDQQFDMALLILDHSIGYSTGWGGLLSTFDEDISQEKVNITGYPGDKGFKEMWTMAHTIKTFKPEQFDYEIDTYGGQSGSAVWINKWNAPMILGVHTLGSHSINSGVRLSGKKFTDLLVKYISKNYTLNNPSISNLSPAKSIIQPFSSLSVSGNAQSRIIQPSASSNISSTAFDEWRKGLLSINKPWAEVIFNKCKFESIKILSFELEKIGDEGANAIANGNFSNLTALNVSSNNISKKEMEELSKKFDLKFQYNPFVVFAQSGR